MTKYMIDGHKLYDFVASGAQNLIVNEHNLNRINVFPVADGDTGTNLALTMKNILTNAKKDLSAKLTMNSIAKVALESAYGNSGMILRNTSMDWRLKSEIKNRLLKRSLFWQRKVRSSMLMRRSHHQKKARF
jgi:dihydroxyacetone kinase-like predicted kinase